MSIHAKGTLIGIDIAGGTAYSDIANVIAVMPPSKKRGTAEATIMVSANDYREHVPGFKEGGEPSFKLLFAKAVFATLDAAFEDGTVIPGFRFQFALQAGEATRSRWQFNAIITELGVPEKSVQGENLWEVDIKLKITGKPVFTAGA